MKVPTKHWPPHEGKQNRIRVLIGKLVDKFMYLSSSVSSTESDVIMRLTKMWITINTLSIVWKSDISDKIKTGLFQAVVVSVLFCGCTT